MNMKSILSDVRKSNPNRPTQNISEHWNSTIKLNSRQKSRDRNNSRNLNTNPLTKAL